MEALKKSLEDLKAADARYHDLLDPAGHMAKATQALAVATAETVLASITSLSERIAKFEAPAAPITPAPSQEPSTAAPDPAPAAAVQQDAKPAVEASDSPAPAG